MATRARADNYDYLIKLLLIGDSGMYHVSLLHAGNQILLKHVASSMFFLFVEFHARMYLSLLLSYVRLPSLHNLKLEFLRDLLLQVNVCEHVLVVIRHVVFIQLTRLFNPSAKCSGWSIQYCFEV